MTALTFNAIITAYVKNGNMPKATEMIDEMKLKSLKPNTLTYMSLLEGCGINKRPELIEPLLKEMRETYKLSPDAEVYQVAIDSCAKCGDLRRGVAALLKMKNEGLWTPAIISKFFTLWNEKDVPSHAQQSFNSLKKKVEDRDPQKEFTSEEQAELETALTELPV